MPRMDEARIDEALAGPLQAVLSVARLGKGPLAVPMSYRYVDGRFVFVTAPDSLHGRLMTKRGRATLTVQYEKVDGRSLHQWYVMAEGPVRFTGEDPMPHVRVILAKDRGAEHVEDWLGPSAPIGVEVAELIPEQLIAMEYRESLDG